MDESVQTEKEEDDTPEQDVGPTTSEAFTCFNTALKWMQQQLKGYHVTALELCTSVQSGT